MLVKRVCLVGMIAGCLFITSALAQDWPALPAENGSIVIPAQEWPYEPGPRTVPVYIRYPGGASENVNAGTGLMLSLHNWGGTDHTGAPDPHVLADRYNVVAISVDYVQSGKYDAATDPPYDFGYLQALDALRALYAVWSGLEKKGVAFDKGRIYTAGGSGGGNVSLMANKLAPRTFAAVVDLSGMARLTGDIAYGIEGGSRLNAGYSQDPDDPRYLTPDAQALRYVGHPVHLAAMKKLGNTATVVVVHGGSDTVCPIEDAVEMIGHFQQAGVDVQPRIVNDDDLDGDVFKNTGHSVGDRTRIVQRVADELLLPDSPHAARRDTPADFDRGDTVRYETPNGHYAISYERGYPESRFVPAGE